MRDMKEGTMHYITEDYLREAYAKEPFDTYRVPRGAKLTPSARQFLLDFHVEFDPYGLAQHTPKQADAVETEDIDAVVADANFAGARLYLLARHALGIDNDTARALADIAVRWQQARLPSDLSSGAEEKEHPKLRPSPQALPLKATIHPVFFEMSENYYFLARMYRVWKSARTAHPQALDAWLDELIEVCDLLRQAITKAAKEG